MAAGEQPKVPEAQIAVHWREEEYYQPPAKFVGQANATDPAIFDRFSEEHFPECFKEYADLLTWDAYWHTTLDTSNPPFWKWFVGGRLNACYNCVDRHLATSRNKAAFIWVPEPESEDTRAITYQELYVRVNEFAALLRDFCGVQAGDRVTFHLPMVPELPVSMLACARLGVIHSEVFGGFSGAACGDRIADSGSHILVTMDGYFRNGELIDHKAKADEAVTTARERGMEVDKVLVWRRHPGVLLDIAGQELGPSDGGSADQARITIRRAHNRLHEAIQTLRELTENIYPVTLVEHGLAHAVQNMADLSPIPLTVNVDPSRWVPPIEVAAYFVISEALANVYKHAEATRAAVTAAPREGQLLVEVYDNGRGAHGC